MTFCLEVEPDLDLITEEDQVTVPAALADEEGPPGTASSNGESVLKVTKRVVIEERKVVYFSPQDELDEAAAAK